MATLNSRGNAIQNPPDTSSIPHAAATLLTAADALSKVSEAIKFASQALSNATHLLSALEGLDALATKAEAISDDTLQTSDMHGCPRPASLVETFAENDLREDSHKSERQGEFVQGDIVTLRQDPSTVTFSSNDSEGEDDTSTRQPSNDESLCHEDPMHESNNKRDSDPAPLLSESEFPTSGTAPQVHGNLRSPEVAMETEAGDAPEYLSADIQSNEYSDEVNLEVDAFELANMIEAYPKFPLGCNHYIQLNQDLDEISVAAYMALQSTKTIFVLQKQAETQWSFSATIITAITGLVVFHPEETTSFDSINRAINGFKADAYPAILLIPHDAFPSIPLPSIVPDCIVHWGIPLDIPNYVQQMYLLQKPVLSCLMLPWAQGSQNWHRKLRNCGIVQYPDVVLQTFFGPTSPFQMVRRLSAQLGATNRFSAESAPAPARESYGDPWSPDLPLEISGEAREAGAEWEPTSPRISEHEDLWTSEVANWMPAGHYYIILEKPKAIDIVSLISYVALSSQRTMCYLPPHRDPEPFRKAIAAVTGLSAMSSSATKDRQLKQPMRQFKSSNFGVFVRPVGISWTSYLSKSVADSLVYCWIPPDINEYMKECSQKMTRSCLVLTRSQYEKLVYYRGAKPFLKELEYPSPPELTSPSKGSLLYTLRSKYSTSSRQNF